LSICIGTVVATVGGW